MNIQTALTDDDLMPFGPYKGMKMHEVPVSYLDGLREQEWIRHWPALLRYIEGVGDAIEIETKKQGAIVDGS